MFINQSLFQNLLCLVHSKSFIDVGLYQTLGLRELVKLNEITAGNVLNLTKQQFIN